MSCKSSAHTASSTFIEILFSCAVPSSEEMLSAQSRAERTNVTHILLYQWIKHEYYRTFVKPVIKAQRLCLRASGSFHTVQDQNRNTGNILCTKNKSSPLGKVKKKNQKHLSNTAKNSILFLMLLCEHNLLYILCMQDLNGELGVLSPFGWRYTKQHMKCKLIKTCSNQFFSISFQAVLAIQRC